MKNLKSNLMPNRVKFERMHELLCNSKKSIVYFFIEMHNDGRNAYHHTDVVVENLASEDWFVIDDNGYAPSFESSDSGLRNAVGYLKEVKRAIDSGHEISITSRVCENESIESLLELNLSFTQLKDKSFSTQSLNQSPFDLINRQLKENIQKYIL